MADSDFAIFKYMRSADAQGLRDHGTIRVGTLFTFRDTIQFGSVIGDREEGAYRVSHKGPTPIWSAENRPTGLKGIIGGEGRVQFSTLNVRIFAHDCYVFSASYERSRELMTRMGKDICFRIIHAHEFVEALAGTVMKRILQPQPKEIGYSDFAKCIYLDKDWDALAMEPMDAAMTKSAAEYGWQKEVRALIKPGMEYTNTSEQTSMLAPFRLSSAECNRFFEEVTVD